MIVTLSNLSSRQGSRYYTQEGYCSGQEQQQYSHWTGRLKAYRTLLTNFAALEKNNRTENFSSAKLRVTACYCHQPRRSPAAYALLLKN